MKKIIFISVLLIFTSAEADEKKSKSETGGTVQSNLSAELQNGKKKAKAICSACHGIDGQAAAGGNSVIIPNITAQHKDYLIARLKAYKAGKIQHGFRAHDAPRKKPPSLRKYRLETRSIRSGSPSCDHRSAAPKNSHQARSDLPRTHHFSRHLAPHCGIITESYEPPNSSSLPRWNYYRPSFFRGNGLR